MLASLNSVLAEPIEDLLLTDADGRPCIETKTTRDLEQALNMPGGNIFHGPLSWPFAEDDDALDTAGRALGRRDAAPAHPAVRLRSASRRRGQRARRPQRGDGRARRLRGLEASPCRLAGRVTKVWITRG